MSAVSHHRNMHTSLSDVELLDNLTDEIQGVLEVGRADASGVVKHEDKIPDTRLNI